MTSPGSDASRPLRILQCASCFKAWGGAELHLLNLSEELVKRGHEVHITAVPGRFVEEDAARRGIPTIPLHQRHTNDLPMLPKLQDIIREHRFDVVHVHGGREYVMPPLAAKLSHVPAVI
ncbi:MAG: glycosyltransferase, partial [Akkermansiaceae bacterium]|nr:glycosyltransferase [Armatimonadota bacterium]